MAVSSTDSLFLAAALKLAERGLFSTTPNPRVGSLLVRDGRVVARGWHERAGGLHAEAAALADAREPVAGTTCYVSLEPCVHHGRTAPCADALIKAGIARVVASMEDPDPRMRGKGFARLREAGIVVDVDGEPDRVARARALNVGFCSRVERGRPWVRLKVAASLDGRTAMATGESRWITGEAARADVQYWRARSCAVLTGAGTVRADDPRLDVREPTLLEAAHARQPLRVILDANLSVAPGAAVLRPPGAALIATGDDGAARSPVHASGVCVEAFPVVDGRLDVAAVLTALASRGVNEVLVEAGPALTGHLLESGLWDEAVIYLAPKFLGSAARPFGTFAIDRLGDAVGGRVIDATLIGADLRVRVLHAD